MTVKFLLLVLSLSGRLLTTNWFHHSAAEFPAWKLTKLGSNIGARNYSDIWQPVNRESKFGTLVTQKLLYFRPRSENLDTIMLKLQGWKGHVCQESLPSKGGWECVKYLWTFWNIKLIGLLGMLKQIKWKFLCTSCLPWMLFPHWLQIVLVPCRK